MEIKTELARFTSPASAFLSADRLQPVLINIIRTVENTKAWPFSLLLLEGGIPF